MGAHDRSRAGTIRLRDGVLECQPESSKAVALNLECETPEMGRLALSTCLLEQREEPYQLMLELARHRIKQFIAKCEDWQIWEHPAAAEALNRWNQAREHFTAAMTSADLAQADEHSSAALVAGLKAGERLAVAHSQVLMHRKFGSKAASKLVLGVRLNLAARPARAATALKDFDMVCLPLPWSKIERSPGEFDFSVLAPWLEWAESTGRTVLAGPLIDLREENVPAWIAAKRGESAVLRDAIWKFAEATGAALAGRVRMWDLAAGLDDSTWWPLDLEERVEVVRRAEIGLRAARKDIPTLVEIEHPFGHQVASHSGALTPRAFIDALVNDGIHIDCLLLRLRMGEAGGEHLTRDLLEVSSVLDTFIPFRKPVFVEIGAPSVPGGPGAGFWRAPWSPKSQAVWAARTFAVAMSKPHVELVLWHSLADPAKSGPKDCAMDGLIASDGTAKPVVAALATARAALRKPIGVWRPSADPEKVGRPSETTETLGG